jgi:hypothetical protein
MTIEQGSLRRLVTAALPKDIPLYNSTDKHSWKTTTDEALIASVSLSHQWQLYGVEISVL